MSEVLSTETKFTPGPWSVLADHPENACAYIKAGDGDEIAVLYGGDECEKDSDGVWGPQPIRDATASLMAAAPDLYKELKLARGWLEDLADKGCFIPKTVFGDIDAALLKARGGPSNEGE